MTALDKYQRLEATGLWRQSPDDPGREVIMQFGKATLVLNASDDSPLAHWSIPAIEIVADDGETTVYALDSDGYETLTTSDRDMRAALSAILAGKTAATDPGPTRGGRILKALTVLVAIAALITLIPTFLSSYSHRLIAPERAGLLSAEMMPMIEARTGPRCTFGPGIRALDSIVARLDPATAMRLDVLDLGDLNLISLPGNHVLLNRRIVETAQSADEIAGWAALGLAGSEKSPALRGLFDGGGVWDGMRFWATGHLADSAKTRAVNRVLIASGSGVAGLDEKAADILSAAELPVRPLAKSLFRNGITTTIGSSEADGRPMDLADGDWVALQEICNG